MGEDVTISGEDSKLDLVDEAYLCARKLGISDRLVVYLACLFSDELFRLLVMISPYGGLGVGVAWLFETIVTAPLKFMLRNWCPGG